MSLGGAQVDLPSVCLVDLFAARLLALHQYHLNTCDEQALLPKGEWYRYQAWPAGPGVFPVNVPHIVGSVSNRGGDRIDIRC